MRLGTTDLTEIGFERAAVWHATNGWLAYRFLDGIAERMAARFAASNALYAFCLGDQVLYIGKTSRSLGQRLKGYCKPAGTQSTNWKCHGLIKDALGRGETVEIFAFAPPADLMFRGFTINLAGGLEDILILKFAPPWNGRTKGQTIAETAEREYKELGEDGLIDDGGEARSEIGRFMIRLKPTYYNRGIINPGRATSSLLGEADGLLTIRFGDGMPAISTRIDRRANGNGSVRLIGGNQIIAEWFQRHYRPDEIVTARILGRYLIELLAPANAVRY